MIIILLNTLRNVIIEEKGEDNRRKRGRWVMKKIDRLCALTDGIYAIAITQAQVAELIKKLQGLQKEKQ